LLRLGFQGDTAWYLGLVQVWQRMIVLLLSEICAGLEWIRLFQVVNHEVTHFLKTYFIIINTA
jgi:hypothetical protein